MFQIYDTQIRVSHQVMNVSQCHKLYPWKVIMSVINFLTLKLFNKILSSYHLFLDSSCFSKIQILTFMSHSRFIFWFIEYINEQRGANKMIWDWSVICTQLSCEKMGANKHVVINKDEWELSKAILLHMNSSSMSNENEIMTQDKKAPSSLICHSFGHFYCHHRIKMKKLMT